MPPLPRLVTASLKRLATAAALLAIGACTHLDVSDCPDEVLGNNDLGSARLRTSHFRVMLQDPPMAAARFTPYAIMSAYAYRLGSGCVDLGNPRDAKARVDDTRDAELLGDLKRSTQPNEQWQIAKLDPALTPACEDDLGLMYHVWERKIGDQRFVVISFRGTSGDGDWVYGNLWPVSHLATNDNQYTRANTLAGNVIAYFRNKTSPTDPPVRLITTGHSLGGGLAQHVLYSHPKDVEQAIVFDPSSITAFSSLPVELQLQGCSCEQSLGTEARIIRVYQTYEILTNLRIVHKTFFAPERHVQEVRFPYKSSFNEVERHSMQDFANNLFVQGQPYLGGKDTSTWYMSQEKPLGGGATSTCSNKLIEAQANSCRIVPTRSLFGKCPQ